MIPTSPSYPNPLFDRSCLSVLRSNSCPNFGPERCACVEVVWTNNRKRTRLDANWTVAYSFLFVYPRDPVVCSPRRRP